jgi:hypothetical protein
MEFYFNISLMLKCGFGRYNLLGPQYEQHACHQTGVTMISLCTRNQYDTSSGYAGLSFVPSVITNRGAADRVTGVHNAPTMLRYCFPHFLKAGADSRFSRKYDITFT